MLKWGDKNKLGYEYCPPASDCIVCGRETSYVGAWKDGREIRVCCKCQKNSSDLIDFAVKRSDRKATDALVKEIRGN